MGVSGIAITVVVIPHYWHVIKVLLDLYAHTTGTHNALMK